MATITGISRDRQQSYKGHEVIDSHDRPLLEGTWHIQREVCK